MDTGEAAPSKTSSLPNFRTFWRAHNPNVTSYPKINRFFKPIVPGFETELRLPLRFCRNLNGEIPGDAILISCRGMWAVALGRCSCHGLLAISGDGWESFIFHHDLKPGDIIWFERKDQMVFRTYVAADLSGCSKELFSEPPETDPSLGLAERGRKRKMEARGGSGWKAGESQFRADIEAHHLKDDDYLTIPSEFLKANDLREKSTAVLLNSSGNAWEVELAFYSDHRRTKISQRNIIVMLGNGWSAFCKSNELKIGDVCLFETDHFNTLSTSTNVVMNVKIVKVF